MVILMGIFIIAPILRNAWMSVHEWYLPRPGYHPFVGLKNYYDVFTASTFQNSLKVTGIYVVVTVLARYVLAMGIALLLNVPFRGRGLVRSIVIIPWAIPVVVACLIWAQMLDFQFGPINYWLMQLGILDERANWLADLNLVLPTAMVVNIWKGTAYPAIMLLAGLQSIPLDLYEAAAVDGASSWRKFASITLPMLKPVSLIVFLLLVIWTIKDFGIIYVLTQGGPAHATEVLTVYVYKRAFEGMRLGEAAAGGMVLLAISMLLTVFYLKVLGGEESVW
jgi:multiple sugar transport system permease protein